MKKIFFIVLNCLFAVSLFAVPAYRGWQDREAADGSLVSVRQVGDEFYHFWETEDGKIALEQPDGRFKVTDQRRPNELQIRAMREASRMQRARMPKSIGERNFAPRGLVLLVEFEDVQFQAANDSAGFSDMLNKSGYDYEGATGSAVDYFIAQSDSAYQPVFDVFGPIKLPHNEEYYGADHPTDPKITDIYIADFVIDAVLAASAEGCDFSKYDSDNDDQVDIVYLLYAGKGQANGGATWTIWPHNWELISALYNEYIHDNTEYYCYYDSNKQLHYNLPIINGKVISKYVCSGELDGKGKRSGIGTLCHEFSHVLGLPDYYDTQYGENSDNHVTPNCWSLMDYGSYNNGGKTPPNYSVYDKYFMGWTTPKFLAKNAKANIELTTGYHDSYQITGGSTQMPFDKEAVIYYLENRQKSGWDEYLPGHGMLVWKIEYDQNIWSANAPNNEVGHPRATVVSAREGGFIGLYGQCVETEVVDGKEYCTKRDTGDYNPFPGSDSVLSYTPFTNCALTEISETNDTIRFKYNGGLDGTEEYTYTIMKEHCTAPEDGKVKAGEELRLIITPEDGYRLDKSACWTVALGTEILVYGTDYTYNAKKNEFLIPAVWGNIVIDATAEKKPQGVEDVQSDALCTKILRQGQLYIIRGGKTYSADGTLVE